VRGHRSREYRLTFGHPGLPECPQSGHHPKPKHYCHYYHVCTGCGFVIDVRPSSFAVLRMHFQGPNTVIVSSTAAFSDAQAYFFFFLRVPRTPWRFARFCPLPCASNTVGFTHWACLVLCVSNTVVFYTVLAFYRVLRTPWVLHIRLALPRASDTTVSCTAFLTNDAPTFLPLCT
jgi:hypothetical protein